MASNNDMEQPFDDDMMLHLALQMSMQQDAASPTSPTAVPSEGAPATASLDAERATPSESTEAVAIEIVQDVVTPNDKTKSTLLEPVAAQEIVSERTPQSVAMETDETKAAAAIEEKNVTSPMKKKKKKKKNSYKDMMSGIMAPTRSEEEARKEYEEKMKQTLGGGEFSKLDKI